MSHKIRTSVSLLLLGTVLLASGCSAGQSAVSPTTPAMTATPAMTTTPVETTPAVDPAAPVMDYTSPNGTPYAWQPQGFYYQEGADKVVIDYFSHDLLSALKTVDGITFMSLEDLRIIYAPDFSYAQEGETITVSHLNVEAQFQVGDPELTYYGGTYTMAAAAFQEGDVLYVPLVDFMCTAFGKTSSENGVYFGLGNSADFTVAKEAVYQLKMTYRGKPVGKSYWTYWNEEVGRLESVVVYIPSSYDAATPNKMIVQLHGASGNATTLPDGASGPDMMRYAEKYGYIVMWPESYVKLGNFGNWVPPSGQVPVTAETDPMNPGNYSEEKLADIALSGNNVQCAMDFVEATWNIDPQNVFCMGISMGGCGTWYQGAFYPERFAALSPSGAFVEPEYFPWEKITLPVLYVGGTEDRNGFDLMLIAYDYALSQGANIEEFLTIGGAPHGGEWTEALAETFDFFERHLS